MKRDASAPCTGDEEPLAIRTTKLTKHLGGRAVVKDVDLRVPQRCVYGFLGPNGAGKTTTMRLVLGLLRADGGRAEILGHDIVRDRRAALAMVGAFVESASLYEHLSGRDNLDLTRRLLRLPASEVDRVLELVDLGASGARRVRGYSLGMKQRLALARALLGKPRVLLLDEPTNGLDPDGIIAMRNLVRSLPERIGGTVFVSSHLLVEVEQVADHAGLMRSGSLILQGALHQILGNGTSFEIEIDDARAGAALLKARGMDVEVIGNGFLRLNCSNTDAMRQAAEANRILVEAGRTVSSLVPRARTLENAYRDAVSPKTTQRAVA